MVKRRIVRRFRLWQLSCGLQFTLKCNASCKHTCSKAYHVNKFFIIGWRQRHNNLVIFIDGITQSLALSVVCIVLSEGGILLLVCLGAACWYKSINKIIGSNCTKASCCGMSIERKPLSEEAAIETQQKFAAIRSAPKRPNPLKFEVPTNH